MTWLRGYPGMPFGAWPERGPQPTSRWRWAPAVAAMLVWLWAAAIGAAAPAFNRPVEAGALKAAHVYKFLSYVEWPAAALGEPNAPLLVGVLGDDVIAAELEALARDHRLNRRAIQVRRLDDGNVSLGDLHVLFIGDVSPAVLGSVLAQVAARPVLTIADRASTGLPAGAIIGFDLVDGYVRFDASLPAAQRAGLRLSARLLSVARRVEQ